MTYTVFVADVQEHANRVEEKDAFTVAAEYVKQHRNSVALVRTADTDEALVVIADNFAYITPEPAS